jgi:putative membrane protein
MLKFTVSAAVLSLAACTNMGGGSMRDGPAREAAAVGDTLQDATGAAQGSVGARMATGASDYVGMAAMSDLYEVQSSQLALQRSQSDAVKAFAQEMISAHTATSNELKPIAMSAGLNPPAALDDRRRSMLENLQNASADDFDDRYIDQQTAAHTEALALHRSYSGRGDNPQLKAFAAKTAPAVEQHLMHVRGLDKGNADG